MNVLLIEDDIQLNTTIESFLVFKNHMVTSLIDGYEAITTIDKEKFDLYIIDINLPNVNGLDIVKYIRNTDLFSPIIIITASMEIDNLKIAFQSGCNEYIKKPFHLEELEIRINKLLNKSTNEIISILPNITYSFDYEELKIDNEIIRIRKKEKRLLTILLLNINHVVSTEKIINYVWENEIKETYALRQLLSQLKSDLGEYKYLIQTEKNSGYKIIGQMS